MKKNHYTTLGVPRNAKVGQIKTAFRKLAAIHHPDVAKDPESIALFQELNEAYETLSGPKRSAYDYALSNALVINLHDTVRGVVDEYFEQFQPKTT